MLSGRIRSENSNTGPAKVYQAGEGFFEPPGSTHTVSENASDSESASLLAIFVADDGVQLTRGTSESYLGNGNQHRPGTAVANEGDANRIQTEIDALDSMGPET